MEVFFFYIYTCFKQHQKKSHLSKKVKGSKLFLMDKMDCKSVQLHLKDADVQPKLIHRVSSRNREARVYLFIFSSCLELTSLSPFECDLQTQYSL